MKILILTNNQFGLYKFRKELLERLVEEDYEVFISVPEDVFTKDLNAIGVRIIHNVYLNRRGTNPLQDLRLINYWKAMIKEIKPDVVLTYTIKPNAYGGWLCGKLGIPYIANVTGLGTSIENGGLMQKVSLMLYKKGLKNAQKVFFQNQGNKDFMLNHRVVDERKAGILPGSGVNTEQHRYESYPESQDPIVFTTVGRIMKDKGIEEVFKAAEEIKKRYPKTEFRLIGDFDENYESKVREMEKSGIIRYLGFQKDIHSFMKESHAIIHTSYHEGMSNILLEASSTGRPVIATDVHGCIETYDDGVTGIGFKAKSADSLIKAIERFMSLSREDRVAMGRAGREKMEREFSRDIVVNHYINEIRKLEAV